MRCKLGASTDEPAPDPKLFVRAVRDVVSVEAGVIIEEAQRLFGQAVRDAVHEEVHEITRESARVLGAPTKDEMARARPPP